MNPTLLIDGYKTDHRRQYPNGTEMVFSNLTARSSRVQGCNEVVFFGLQYFIKKYLISQWNTEFFRAPKSAVLAKYKRRMDAYLGEGAISTDHLGALHDLGYLPLHIMALPEGSRVPLRVPMLVMWNTHPDFFWLTNYMETLLSCVLWGPITSATTALRYKRILTEAAKRTGADTGFVPFQAHDFSMRGMFGVEAAMMSGAAHLTSFVGTDSIPAIEFLEHYYGASGGDMIGVSVPATEHSVMCMGGEGDEIGTFRRLITELYPNGIVSIVSDTWDFWKVVTEYLPVLKSEIMARDGKVVIRPDSGDPAHIICGTWFPPPPEYMKPPAITPEQKGLVECLWDIFGGTVNAAGFKELDPHIGCIYGDSITPERAEEIVRRLEAKGFASTNVVFGVGSYTYQYATRDTFGMAVKATYGIVNGEPRNIFKKPKTDNGTKNSAKGLLAVYRDERDGFVLKEEVSIMDVMNCAFVDVFMDGSTPEPDSLNSIRERIGKQI